MNSFPNSPRLLRGSAVLLDPVTSQVTRVVALQYNPNFISRTPQLQAVVWDQLDRPETLQKVSLGRCLRRVMHRVLASQHGKHS
jgi:hypothetical protein